MWNASRIAGIIKIQAPKKCQLKDWLQKEVDLLVPLDQYVPNSMTKNLDIKKYLADKTCKQISDKRRMLRLKTEKTARH